MEEEIDYLLIEIQRYCYLNINNNVGDNVSSCIIFEISKDLKTYFIENFINEVCKFTNSSKYFHLDDQELIFSKSNYFFQEKIKYSNNFYLIECELIDFDSYFNVEITTIHKYE